MTEDRSITLYFTEGSSDKEYQLRLEAKDAGYVVNFAYGRRGSSLKTGTKTQAPVSYEAAAKIYDKILAEKTSKGYTPSQSGTLYVNTGLEGRRSGIAPQLPTAIQIEDVEAYEQDSAWVAQEKHDGENRIIIVENGAVTGVNRRGLTCSVPADWNADDIPHADGRTVLCGEDMGDVLVVFDALEIDGRSLRELGFEERYYLLEDMHETSGAPDWMEISKIAVNTAAKKSLLQRVIDEDLEGVVYKRSNATFDAGRSLNAMKYKIQESSTFEVITRNAQRSVEIGLKDQTGKMVPMGNVTIPANQDIPAVGALVEVAYMYRWEDGGLMQPRYKGERTDIDGPATLDQIKRIKAKTLAA